MYVDDYRKRMVASCDGKTIITVNPGLWKFHLTLIILLVGLKQNALKVELHYEYSCDQKTSESIACVSSGFEFIC